MTPIFNDTLLRWFSKFRNLSGSHSQITSGYPAAGLYHYTLEGEGWKSRAHLRVSHASQGVIGLLVINASRVVHLNPTATLMAFQVLQKTPENEAIAELCRIFAVNENQAQQDYAEICQQIEALTRPDSACPVHDLNLDIAAPFTVQPSAPYRMDLALTYRCNNDCSHCYNARSKAFPELQTSDWFQILDHLWEIGIPHVVFTGGEPTLRDDLPDLIAHAECNGQITGVNTNARRLSDPRFLDSLVTAGLDHVQITVESHDPTIHDQMVCAKGAWKQTIAGLKNALDTRLFVMTNTTLLAENSPLLEQTLEFLAELGVPTIGLNALIYSGRGRQVGTGLPESSLPGLLQIAREKTGSNQQKLIWYTPTQYCHFDPMQLELGVKGCTAALYNMCIEPNGDVIPCQSYYQPLGNIRHNEWDTIWNHELSIYLRERRYAPEKCGGCALFAECGGGCPLQLELVSNSQPHPVKVSDLF